MIVYGKIKHGRDDIAYSVELPYEDITQSAMPIEESTVLIVDAINKKYGTNFPYSIFMTVEFKK
ncbi:hypothetical protein QUF88_14715 [Bacillus sp. DX1.1]|uniref:hypothetical protein n=1 Tax=unclassified Bacillus (in: firmicutes) TaxID=185979 RepID=UPI0025705883|nr:MULTISPECIES: hypothetical protein [unclassified Bacillus (in: firmicutes)]MDM5155023.1 hypothetical protein [Bacillus sp. DX1.1]WJE83885.1 hypothetical protein QRE67_12210 [Bacillus sp. DX3.1]